MNRTVIMRTTIFVMFMVGIISMLERYTIVRVQMYVSLKRLWQIGL